MLRMSKIGRMLAVGSIVVASLTGVPTAEAATPATSSAPSLMAVALPSGDGTEWNMVNDSNEVVGAYINAGDTHNSAVTWQDGSLTTLAVPSNPYYYDSVYAEAVDSTGDVFGRIHGTNDTAGDQSQGQPVLWSPSGDPTSPYTGEYNGLDYLESASPNGNVAGVWCGNNGQRYTPCQYVAAMAPTSSGAAYQFATVPVTLSNVGSQVPISINNSGELAVGGSVYAPSYILPTGYNGAADPANISLAGTPFQLNDKGDYIGSTSSGVGVLELASGTIETLPTLKSGDNTYPTAVNDSDEVVGTDCTSTTCTPVAWIDGKVQTIASMIGGSFTGTIEGPVDINNNGSILVAENDQNNAPTPYLLEATPNQLSISSLTLDPVHPTVNDGSITATLTVRNDSADKMTDVASTLTSGTPEALSVDSGPDPATDATLDPGETTSFSYQLTPLQAETVNLQPAATAVDHDGKAIIAPTVPPRIVDLSAGDVSISLAASPTDPATNQATTETATITNKTGSTLSNLTGTLSATLDGAPAATVTIGDPTPTTLASLAPHDTTTISWPVMGTDPGNFQLVADIDLTDPNTGDEDDVGRSALDIGGATITVNSTDDTAEPDDALANQVCDVDPNTDGNQCTLRAAIAVADTMTNDPTIAFDIAGGGVPVISPASALPSISTAMTIDGTTQSGGWVQLSGAMTFASASGLVVSGGGPTIRGLAIDGWSFGSGIEVTGGAGTTIVGDRIGTDPTGTTAVPNQTGITAGGTSVTVGGVDNTTPGQCTGDCDLVSGNQQFGIAAAPDNAVTLDVLGDFIGTDVTGETAIPNSTGISDGFRSTSATGILVVGGQSSSPGVAPGNLISGNAIGGVSSGVQTMVSGNLIGLDAAGGKSLAAAATDLNAPLSGVASSPGAKVTVGGTVLSDENVISGFATGVSSQGPVTADHDRIGTDITGTKAIPNAVGVGGTGDGVKQTTVADSVISGNSTDGAMDIASLTGSLVGTTADGSAALPNQIGVAGVTQVGGLRPAGSSSCTTPCNVISGNHSEAIASAGSVEGNFIGTDLDGTSAIPNNSESSSTTSYAVGLDVKTLGGVSHAATSGACDEACNLISGNAGAATETGGSVQGNVIGVSMSGDSLPNGGAGVRTFADSTAHAVVGGDGDLGNVIADNTGPAIDVTNDAGSSGSVDPDIFGNRMYGNAGGGITVDRDLPGRVTRAPAKVTASSAGSSLTITGDLLDLASSGGSQTARVDVYGDNSCSSSTQGQTPIGHASTSLYDDSAFTITASGAATSVVHNIVVTATEIDPTNDTRMGTSTFTGCIPIASAASLSPASGGTDKASAPGFTDGEPVNVTLHSKPIHIGTVTASSTGVATASVKIPKSFPAGAHEIIFTGETSGHIVTIPITVTPPAQTGLLHLVTAKPLYSKAFRHSAMVEVIGHAGIPPKGVRHVLVLATTTSAASIDGHRVASHSNALLVLPASKARLSTKSSAHVTMTALGWYASAKSDNGNVLRTVKPTTITRSGYLDAGKDHLPFEPALAGVVVTVMSNRAGTRVGDITLPASSHPTSVVVPVVDGRVNLHLASKAKVTVTGWYGAPSAAPGGKTTG